ncbi:MAG: hypothetical protein WAV00_14590, partial [Nocardioides sp.]
MSLLSPRPIALRADPARVHSRALRALPVAALLLDLALVTTTVFLAGYLRTRIVPLGSGSGVGFSSSAGGPGLVESIMLVALPLIVGWIALIALQSGYDRALFGAGADEYKSVVNASLLAAGVLGIGCYLTKLQLSRGFFMVAFLLGPPLLVAGRYALRRALHRARRRGSLGQPAIILGAPQHVDAIASVLSRESWLGYHVAGALLPTALRQGAETEAGVPVLGTVDEAARLIRAHDAEVVFVVGGAFSDPSQMRDLTWDLENDAVHVIMAPGVTDISSERIRARP